MNIDGLSPLKKKLTRWNSNRILKFMIKTMKKWGSAKNEVARWNIFYPACLASFLEILTSTVPLVRLFVIIWALRNISPTVWCQELKTSELEILLAICHKKGCTKPNLQYIVNNWKSTRPRLSMKVTSSRHLLFRRINLTVAEQRIDQAHQFSCR
jgi:hypothetical protein